MSGEFKPGDAVMVNAFTATIIKSAAASAITVSRPDGTVAVRDRSGLVHYVCPEQLTRPVPYENGKVYLDSDGDFWQYSANGNPFEPGKWHEYDTERRVPVRYPFPFSTPPRPLREVTFGEDISE